MQDTPRGNRMHIAIFGRRNAGKSSLINALTNQELAIVSDVPGTTTDPVYKSMEILPLGPVVLIDTAGLDDIGELGQLRVQKSLEVLAKTDLALVVVDANNGVGDFEQELAALCREKNIPLIGVINKSDTLENEQKHKEKLQDILQAEFIVAVSARTKAGINELKLAMVRQAPADFDEPSILGDLINPGDTVVLVTPIDTAAPKGRLILPQVQVIRDILDNGGLSLVVTENEIKNAISSLKTPPSLVITDSQVFPKANAETPPEVFLTSFSILYARYKGNLEALLAGAKALLSLKPGDRVLISEACTHHRMQDDIGTVKLPRWIEKHVGGKVHFDWSSGGEFPKDIEKYQVVVHCGACMINRKAMLSRIMHCQQAGVPIVNYGVAIAALNGILPRVLSPFSNLVSGDKSE